MKEETGLTILNPRIVGIKQFPMKNGNYEEGRYVVLLFKVTEFTGEVISSAEGQMEWISYDHISEIGTVDDFDDLLEVMNDSNLTEFQYIVDGDDWNVLKK